MSSYAKALEGVMRLFPKKITVTFVHVSGVVIGVCKIYEENLPEVFKRPVVIEALGRSWRVLEAEPRENKDFVYRKKLRLVVVEPERAGEYVKEYFVPTVAGAMPEVTGNSVFSGFEIVVSGEEWRQVEFLPAADMSVVNEEVRVIEDILSPGKGGSVLRGYKKRHVREEIFAGAIGISLIDFCNVVDSSKLGALQFESTGYVQDGFVLESIGYTYYGIVRNNVIKYLCLHKFDCADFELFTVLSTFNLILVHWCKGKIFTSEVTELSEDAPTPGTGQTDII